jgi:hypothetical protein
VKLLFIPRIPAPDVPIASQCLKIGRQAITEKSYEFKKSSVFPYPDPGAGWLPK